MSEWERIGERRKQEEWEKRDKKIKHSKKGRSTYLYKTVRSKWWGWILLKIVLNNALSSSLIMSVLSFDKINL